MSARNRSGNEPSGDKLGLARGLYRSAGPDDAEVAPASRGNPSFEIETRGSCIPVNLVTTTEDGAGRSKMVVSFEGFRALTPISI